MSHIDMSSEHHLTIEQSREMMTNLAESLAKKYHATYTIVNDVLSFKAPGIEGTVVLLANAVTFKAKLGLLMRPLKGVIEKQVEDEFAKIMAETKRAE